MARLSDALLSEHAFGISQNQPMLDITKGGQFGWAPNLSEWVSNQAYVRRNLICVLLEAPKFFHLMPDSQKWVDCLKSMLELHCRTIEGYNAGLTVEFAEHNIGGAGEVQHEVTDVKRAQSNPSFSFVEKYGMPIQTFLHNWITYGMMDPDTKYAMIGTLPTQTPSDMLADWYSASVLVFEPDPTHRKVIKSWVTANMMPKANGDIIGKRDLSSASELTELTIEFTGFSQTNLGTNIFAQRILNAMNQANSNPYLRPSFITEADMTDPNASAEGYKKNLEDLGKNAITPSISSKAPTTNVPGTIPVPTPSTAASNVPTTAPAVL